MHYNEIPEFDFRGIKRIEIPYADKDFASGDYGASVLNKYMPNILKAHEKNAKKEEYLYEYMQGIQDIRFKNRLYQKDQKNNNIISQNHAYRQVQFKVGFLTSEQREYTHKADVQTDDLIYLDRYFTDTQFYAKDKDIKEWAYATGVGVAYVEPRTDIIAENGRYLAKEEGYDIENQAPYYFESLDPTKNFVVYSSGRNKEPLFCVSVVETDIGKDNTIQIAYKITIETRYAYFECETNTSYGAFKQVVHKGNKSLHFIPMIEQTYNASRMGIVELNREPFNAVNQLLSSVEDMVIDNANMIFVFKNVDASSLDLDNLKEKGAVVISDTPDMRGGGTADIKTITIEIPFNGFIDYTESLLVPSYDIAGVPLASGQVTSGGDTGQARLLGGGWNNAYISINSDITSFKRTDYVILDTILLMCRQVPNCPVNELSASQIDIKYRINQSDNFLVKTQGIYQLWQANFPYEETVKASGLFSDSVTVAKKWKEKDELAKAQANTTKETVVVDEKNKTAEKTA